MGSVDPAAIRAYRATHPGASVRDVARAVGCSSASVSFALNGRPRPRDDGREFSEAELTAGPPDPVEERTAGERSADRRAAELHMSVGAARLDELLAEFRQAVAVWRCVSHLRDANCRISHRLAAWHWPTFDRLAAGFSTTGTYGFVGEQLRA